MARELGSSIGPKGVTVLATSLERKAVETCASLSWTWEIPVTFAIDLAEVRRPWVKKPVAFRKRVHAWLGGERVRRWEPIEEVFGRVDRTLHKLLDETGGDVVAVGHGTAMALWLGRVTSSDPVEWWEAMAMPHVTILSVDESPVPAFRVKSTFDPSAST